MTDDPKMPPLPPPLPPEYWMWADAHPKSRLQAQLDRIEVRLGLKPGPSKDDRWAAFTNDELYGLYSIISGLVHPLDPKTPLGRIREEVVAEMEARR